MLREILSTFLLSLLFLNFTLMTEKLLRLSRILAGVGVSIIDLVQIILYLQPQLLILTIPMAMLLSVLLAYGRMNVDNEIVIMRGSGMSFRSISRPVAYIGSGCFIVSVLMSFYVGPLASTLLREKVTEVLTVRAPLTIEEGIFNTSFRDIIILVRSKPAPDMLSGIFIVDDRKKDEQKIITAREGRIVPGKDLLSFTLSDGHVYITKKNVFTEIRFGSYHFQLNPSMEQSGKKKSEYTPPELLQASRQEPSRGTDYLLEFHRRLSLPAICIVIIFLGLPLSLIAGKSGRLGGLTIGLSVFAIYYTLLLYGENLVRSDFLPHFAGAWLPFVVLVGVSYALFDRTNRR